MNDFDDKNLLQTEKVDPNQLDYRLKNIYRKYRVPKIKAKKLQHSLNIIMKRTRTRSPKKFQNIKDAFQNLLPQTLKLHSQITRFANSTLTVKVDSPVFLYEMNLIKNELIRKINDAYPNANLKNIKFLIG